MTSSPGPDAQGMHGSYDGVGSVAGRQAVASLPSAGRIAARPRPRLWPGTRRRCGGPAAPPSRRPRGNSASEGSATSGPAGPPKWRERWRYRGLSRRTFGHEWTKRHSPWMWLPATAGELLSGSAFPVPPRSACGDPMAGDPSRSVGSLLLNAAHQIVHRLDSTPAVRVVSNNFVTGYSRVTAERTNRGSPVRWIEAPADGRAYRPLCRRGIRPFASRCGPWVRAPW